MAARPEPSPANGFLADHARLLLDSFEVLTGRCLFPGRADMSDEDAARSLYHAPFFLASHDTAPDPVLTYGNRTAQQLFEMSWAEFTSTPSRLTAQAPLREERTRLLERVRIHGFIDDYSGVRISATGRRFRIERATVWNLLAPSGDRVGQAATFSRWLPEEPG